MYGLQIAIVGCGRMGHVRWSACRRLGAHVVAVCDSDPIQARNLIGEASDVLAVSTPDELPWDSLDAVFVCVPPAARGQVEFKAIEAETPVFVEKPIGLNAEHCLPILRALERQPVITAVGYMNRCRPSVQKARDLLADSAVLGVSCHWLGRRYAVPWWSQAKLSGGAINEQATHLLDLCRFLVGEIEAVQAITLHGDNNEIGEEAVAINLRFVGNRLGSIFYSCQADRKMIELQAFTAQQEVRLTGWEFALRNDGTDESPVRAGKDPNMAFDVEVENFFRAIAHADPDRIMCDFRDAFKTQRVVDAVRKSLRTASLEHLDQVG